MPIPRRHYSHWRQCYRTSSHHTCKKAWLILWATISTQTPASALTQDQTSLPAANGCSQWLRERSERNPMEIIVMCLEIGELTDPMAILDSQIRFIRDQDTHPASSLKVRCVCLKLVSIRYAYRCLYCGIFYCRECAEQHFGKTVAEYRSEHGNT